MPIIQDKEFGKITIRRSTQATQVRMRVAPDGTLRASVPLHAPLFIVKQMLAFSRNDIRKMLSQAKPEYEYQNGMQIGKSHTLIIQEVNSDLFDVKHHGQQIIIRKPINFDISLPIPARKIRDEIIAALRIEAKSYLPKRLAYLAEKYGFKYSKVRFSHASGRWGSCNTNGTISLNIALMKLPFELIDYVLIHELSHTIEMNHSMKFWKIVSSADPGYKNKRRLLKLQNPSI